MTKQTELNQVIERIDAMELRRDELLQTLNKAKTEQREREQQLGRELLAGKPGKALVEQIANERTLVGGLEDAIKQADAAIEALKAERAQIEQGIAFEAYAQQVKEGREKLYECIRHLDQVNVNLAAVRLEKPRDYPESEEEKLVFYMKGHIGNFDIYRELLRFEQIAPTFMEAARKGAVQ